MITNYMQPYGSFFNMIILPNGSISQEVILLYFKRIEDLRIDNDLTQQDIADMLQIQREVYRRYEKGYRTIPIDYLMKLADFYHTSIDYLVGRNNKK